MLPRSAGRRVGAELRAIFDGDADAAAEAVEQLCSEPKVLEAWATRMLRAEPMPKKGERMPDTGPNCTPFSIKECNAAGYDAAVRGLAMAYLVATHNEENRSAS